MLCRFCDSPLPEDARFCPKCGRAAGEVPRDTYCPRCGRLRTGASWCITCPVDLRNVWTSTPRTEPCPTCRSTSPSKSRFCIGCGRDLRDPDGVVDDEAEADSAGTGVLAPATATVGAGAGVKSREPAASAWADDLLPGLGRLFITYGFALPTGVLLGIIIARLVGANNHGSAFGALAAIGTVAVLDWLLDRNAPNVGTIVRRGLSTLISTAAVLALVLLVTSQPKISPSLTNQATAPPAASAPSTGTASGEVGGTTPATTSDADVAALRVCEQVVRGYLVKPAQAEFHPAVRRLDPRLGDNYWLTGSLQAQDQTGQSVTIGYECILRRLPSGRWGNTRLQLERAGGPLGAVARIPVQDAAQYDAWSPILDGTAEGTPQAAAPAPNQATPTR